MRGIARQRRANRPRAARLRAPLRFELLPPGGHLPDGPGERPHGGVDDQLRVRGVEGLRVADASIMPTVTSGNTYAPSLMIGAKAADLILGRTPAPADIAASPAGQRKVRHAETAAATPV